MGNTIALALLAAVSGAVTIAISLRTTAPEPPHVAARLRAAARPAPDRPVVARSVEGGRAPRGGAAVGQRGGGGAGAARLADGVPGRRTERGARLGSGRGVIPAAGAVGQGRHGRGLPRPASADEARGRPEAHEAGPARLP